MEPSLFQRRVALAPGALRKRQAGQKNNLHDPSNLAIQAQSPNIKQPAINVLDAKTGAVEVTNRVGKIKITLPVTTDPGSDGIFIKPVPEIPDNMLFEPVVINGQQGVGLNIGHDFYRKVYLPNRDAGGAILGMDSLLWALCVAELNNCTPATTSTFREIRYELSKILRNLVDKLPDPVLEADE